MIVAPAGEFFGTIGGGALEWELLAEARAMATDETEGIRHRQMTLGPDLGQCCGGSVVARLERFAPADAARIAPLAQAEEAGSIVTVGVLGAGGVVRRLASGDLVAMLGRESYRRLDATSFVERFGVDRTPLLLFGAGHVGRALACALAPLPFHVTWIDSRPGAFGEAPPGVTTRATEDYSKCLETAPDDAMILVMTHSHGLDLDIVAEALRKPKLRYVGLIGSATKRARFVAALRRMDVPDPDRLVCPIGIAGIVDKAPAAIAAATVAQLLMVRAQVERGDLS